MKRLLSLFFALIMIFSLCACTGTGNDSTAGTTDDTTAGTTPSGNTALTGQFVVGYGKGDITPKKTGLIIAGGGSKLSTGFASYLSAICIAVTDADGNTAIIMSVDTTNVSEEIVADLEKYVNQEYGLPIENITISSIHQHSTPAWSDEDYYKQAIEAMKQAIDDAMEDRAPAEMYINTVETEAMTFVRHYFSKVTNTVVGDNYNNEVGKIEGFAGHVTEADNDMQLLKFVREGKDPIIVVNFQCHPMNGWGITDVHGDWPAIMREKAADALGANMMYISGAGGNLSSRTYIASELPYEVNDWKAHGEKAANYVIRAEDSYTKVNTGKVEVKFISQDYPVDHSMDDKADIAKAINDAMRVSEAEAKKILEKYPNTFSSVHHAVSAYQKSQMGETIDISVGVISIGDVAFSCHQYEMFDTNGMELKQGTVGNANYPAEDQMENPYAMTVVTTMAKGTKEYIPSKYGYEYGGYEQGVSKFAAGSGELLVTSYLEILNELYGE